MKKLMAILAGTVLLAACSNNGGQTGVQNDGTHPGDTNGGVADTPYHNQGATDTSKMEHRVDISTRDTFKNKP